MTGYATVVMTVQMAEEFMALQEATESIKPALTLHNFVDMNGPEELVIATVSSESLPEGYNGQMRFNVMKTVTSDGTMLFESTWTKVEENA